MLGAVSARESEKHSRRLGFEGICARRYSESLVSTRSRWPSECDCGWWREHSLKTVPACIRVAVGSCEKERA
eukprot:9232282-Pyramimonas_sp.AAC.1